MRRGRPWTRGSGTGWQSGDWPPGSFPDSNTWVSQELCQGQGIQNPNSLHALVLPTPPKKHREWPGAVLAPGLRFRLTWVSVTFQPADLRLIPYLLASVSSPVKWAKCSICQNKDEMGTRGTSVNSGMFVFSKYLLHVYYGPGTELIVLHMRFHLILRRYC